MPAEWSRLVPVGSFQLAVVLLLSFLVGLEREEHKAVAGHPGFGGVRAFPLIGLVGYGLALLSGDRALPIAVGFVVVGAFLVVSYHHKLVANESAGAATEISALVTFLVGALVERGHLWTGTALAILLLLLLELKALLERVAERVGPDEVVTLTKFLLLTCVVLPIVPNEEFGYFRINPFKTWLVVVAVSGISYGSYVSRRLMRERGGVVLAALLGGAYSSTATTVVLAKQAAAARRPSLFSGAILVASGVMYARLAALLALFAPALAKSLAPSFLCLAVVGCVVGFLVSRRPDPEGGGETRPELAKNPLELRTALLFAVVFVAVLVLTKLTIATCGTRGVYGLAAIMGVTDVDPFILGMTQTAPGAELSRTAAVAIVIAAASNNVAKGIYAYAFGDRATGRRSLVLLLGLAALGAVPLAWQ